MVLFDSFVTKLKLTPGNEKTAGKAPKPEGFSLISCGK